MNKNRAENTNNRAATQVLNTRVAQQADANKIQQFSFPTDISSQMHQLLANHNSRSLNTKPSFDLQKFMDHPSYDGIQTNPNQPPFSSTPYYQGSYFFPEAFKPIRPGVWKGDALKSIQNANMKVMMDKEAQQDRMEQERRRFVLDLMRRKYVLLKRQPRYDL